MLVGMGLQRIELFIITIVIFKIAHMFTNDANIAFLGLLSSATCFDLFVLTNSDWMIYGGNALICLFSFFDRLLPFMQSVIVCCCICPHKSCWVFRTKIA